tara:strand:- start:1935 stop:2150 length:216 start_codon:yes stop_codon:yes gene_type:complete
MCDDAEEKVFTIPGLRLLILSFAIEDKKVKISKCEKCETYIDKCLFDSFLCCCPCIIIYNNRWMISNMFRI